MPPQDPNKTGAGHIDLNKVLLPKKGGTSVDSAQRINAGVLFEQEQKASTLGPDTSGGKSLSPSEASGEKASLLSGASDGAIADNPAPTAPPQPKPEQPLVRPLQTYQGDIESLVGEKQVSVVTIAAAEADRRATQQLSPEQAALVEGPRRPWLRTLLVVGAGVVLLLAAGGIGFYIYLALQPVPVAEQFPAPFILVDDTHTVEMGAQDTRSAIMQTLAAARKDEALALGLVARLQVVKQTPLGVLQEVGAPELLQLVAPQIPPELVRTLLPQMLLGVHSYDENQAFMILKADSYETAYSGMLGWESTMQADLSPLFARTPAVRPRAQTPTPAVVPLGTSTASTSSGQAATSTQAASTTPAAASTTPLEPVQFFGGNFIDQVVANRDARVVLNQQGDIVLLWTMLDRSTIIVTTNDATLREVISRLSQASILSLPAGQ